MSWSYCGQSGHGKGQRSLGNTDSFIVLLSG